MSLSLSLKSQTFWCKINQRSPVLKTNIRELCIDLSAFSSGDSGELGSSVQGNLDYDSRLDAHKNPDLENVDPTEKSKSGKPEKSIGKLGKSNQEQHDLGSKRRKDAGKKKKPKPTRRTTEATTTTTAMPLTTGVSSQGTTTVATPLTHSHHKGHPQHPQHPHQDNVMREDAHKVQDEPPSHDWTR